MEYKFSTMSIQTKINKLLELQLLDSEAIQRFQQFMTDDMTDFSENTYLLIFLFNEKQKAFTSNYPFYIPAKYGQSFDDFDNELKTKIIDSFLDCIQQFVQLGMINSDFEQILIEYINESLISPCLFFKKAADASLQIELFSKKKLIIF